VAAGSWGDRGEFVALPARAKLRLPVARWTSRHLKFKRNFIVAPGLFGLTGLEFFIYFVMIR
jgi:hypothetical protein